VVCTYNTCVFFGRWSRSQYNIHLFMQLVFRQGQTWAVEGWNSFATCANEVDSYNRTLKKTFLVRNYSNIHAGRGYNIKQFNCREIPVSIKSTTQSVSSLQNKATHVVPSLGLHQDVINRVNSFWITVLGCSAHRHWSQALPLALQRLHALKRAQLLTPLTNFC